mmetsp:Transcript_37946/g.68330  ORF Transcript_37946/g.68330 Transcript_37946/m.68330 type:complete len:585 (+) Transcript_37946:2-1756(+)
MDSLKGSLKEAAGDVYEYIDDKVDMPVIIDINGIKRAGGAVYTTSRETSDLCHTTMDKTSEIIAFGLELKETLDGLSEDGTLEASKFEIIKDLVDGDRIRAATALAGELGDLALQCVDKSQEMMEAIELGIDTLPDFIEDHIENKMDRAAEKGGKEGDPDLPDVETHSRELQTLISDVEGVNLFTVMSSGKLAFDGLRSKGEVCQNMFTTIRDFSEDVSQVSDAIQKFTLGTSLGEMKESFKGMKELVSNAWRCLRLSNLIKLFAEGVGKIIRWIVSLFQRASEKLGSIWGALARAKDVLADCVQYVVECIKLCNDAKDRSGELCDVSAEIREHLRNIVRVDKSAIASIKDLSDGDEIRRAIQLATTMDDIVKECVMHILETIQKVCGAIKSMPDVLKESIDEGGEDGSAEGGGGTTRAVSFGIDDDDDETPPADGVDVSGDVEELDRMRGAIEEANVFESVEKSAEGFDGIKDKIGLCGDMITKSRGFADTCNTTIESFGGAWDLESAQNHILELFEIVSLGKLIKHFAQEIMKLIRANIALMEAVMQKFKDIDFVPDQLEDLIDDIGDGLKDLGKKLKFWDK